LHDLPQSFEQFLVRYGMGIRHVSCCLQTGTALSDEA
jgi:hypothetical protein